MDSYETASIPLRRHQPSFTRTITDQAVERLESTSDGSSASPNLVLLTKLVRIITTRGLPEFNINLDSNTFLGAGATYQVSKATVSTFREEYGGQRELHTFALKIAKLHIGRTFSDMGTNPAERRRLKVILFELDVLSRPNIQRHPNIVTLLGFSWGETAYGYAPSLVMELATMGTAREYTSAEPMLSDSKRLALCRDVASGLRFLHSLCIVHGDVKQDNVLIFADTEADEGFVAKLSDLERCPANHDALKYTGTTIYNAPEVRTLGCAEQELFWLCDAFSFGLLSFEVLSGVTWKHVLGDKDDACMGQRAIRNECLELACDFIKNSWQGSNTLRSICQDIARATLTDDPLKRLLLGWNMILSSLQHNDDVEMEAALIEEPTQLADSDASYSILEIHNNIGGIFDDRLGDAMWFDLTHTISSTNNMEHKGNSAFNLFILYSLGRFGKFDNVKEALKYLEIAAECQYGPAFIVGKRMFEANGLRDNLPQIFINGPKDSHLRQKIHQLESLSNELYYSSAIRTFWPPKLRADALRIVSKRPDLAPMELGRGSAPDLASNIRKIRNEQASEAQFCALAEESCLLHYSVLNSDYEACKLLLELQCGVNSTMPGGMTPFHLACRCVEVEIMELLLSHGADASLCDENNISPLHWLVLLPDKDIRPMANIIMCHCKEAQIEFTSMIDTAPMFFDDLGLMLQRDPMSWAVSCCNLAAVQAMLDFGFFSADDEEETRYYLGVAMNHVCTSIMEYFLGFCRHTSPHDKEHLYLLLGRGVSSFTRWLIHGSAHDKTLGEALDLLERFRFRLPLNRRDMVSDAAFTPLGRAVISYDISLIKELIKRGANVNDAKDGILQSSILSLAFSSSYAIGPRHQVIDTIKLLLDHGATNEREPPLHMACFFNVDPSIFQLLINRDSQAIRTIFNEETPLLNLIKCGVTEDLMTKVKLLIDIPRADLDIESYHSGRNRDCCGTALAYSLIILEWDIAELLLDRDVSLDLGIKGGHRQSVLHLLIHHASSILSTKRNVEWGVLLSVLDKLLRYLALKGRDVINPIDHNGDSPLRLAINYALPSIVKKLLWRDYGIFKETVQEEYALLQQSLLIAPHSEMMRGQMNVIAELLEAHLNINEAVANRS